MNRGKKKHAVRGKKPRPSTNAVKALAPLAALVAQRAEGALTA